MNKATMPMAGIFTEADIRDDEQFGADALEETNSLLNNAARVIGLRAHFILFAGNTKKKHCRDTKTGDPFSLPLELLQRPLHDTWHRNYFVCFMNSLCYEEGVDELINRKASFAHEAP